MASTPKPPDPYKTAAAQQGAEMGAAQASAVANNPNRYTPWGSQTYTPAGYHTVYDASGKPQQVMRWNETQTLSPDQQKLLALQTQAGYNLGNIGVQQSAKLGNILNTSLDTSGVEAWNRGNAPGQLRRDEGPTDRAAIEKAILGRWDTDAARQNAAQEAQLAARGLAPGSAQYGSVREQQDRARTDALNQAYLASGQESRAAQEAYNAATTGQYQLGQDYASFLNNLRGAQMGEKTALRNQPINEIAALLGMGQVQQPQFAGFTGQGINAAPVGSYIQSNYGNQAQQAAAMNQGLFGLGSAGIYGAFMSDRRLKEAIEPLGEVLAGVPLYRFRFKGQPETQVGVMADEVRPLHPDAVMTIDGYDAVDYGLLLARHGRD